MNRLSPEDQQRVDRYLSSGVNQTERKPFRIWRLFAFIWALLGVMGGVSYWLALRHGVI
ncbi:DUF3094 domain-containing protein [Aestuariicella sp. G3-2]|nr:DUF3094 domain-containing protein [Aestuariicella albida]